MAGIILLEAVESLQSNHASQARTERSVSLVDLGKKLLEAARLGDTEEVRRLMTNGAPFTTDWLGTSPLHLAAQYGHIDTAEVLIRAGISRDARTKVDRTPLHVAAQEGHVDIVELLIKNGTDIDARDMLKMTPLHWAVERGHISIIELLLENGADINSLSKFDKTPATVAFDNGRLDIVQLLTCGDFAKRLSAIEESETSARMLAEEHERDAGGHHADESMELAVEAGEDDTEDNIVLCAAEEQSPPPLKTIPSRILQTPHRIYRHRKPTDKTEQANNTQLAQLAQLASLAESIGPLSAGNGTSAADTLRWLEQNGITIGDNSTIIASAIESGQTISLTEAGKLALGWAKKQNSTKRFRATAPTLEQRIENVVADITDQKVFAIVADQSQIPSLVSGEAGARQILVTMSDSALESPGEVVSLTLNAEEPPESAEPTVKRPKKTSECAGNADDDVTKMDRDQLTRLLEEAQRKAKEYEEQLRVKQHEADEYKKKLESIVSSPKK